jgi:hypothetical protein
MSDRYPHREGSGRRVVDGTTQVVIPPYVISITAFALVTMIGIIGFMLRGWASSITSEIHQLRLVSEKQLEIDATNAEWRRSIMLWQSDIDSRLKLVQYQLDGRRPLVWPKPTHRTKQELEGASK